MNKDLRGFQFSIEAEVQSFQVRPDGKIWLHALADWFQEIAWRHANSGGFGTKINQSQLMWALARLEIKAKKLPTWGDRFKLYTAGRGVNKIFAFREFLLTDSEGEKLVEGMSSWLLLDSATKRPKNPEEVLPESLFNPKLKPNWEPGKIRVPNGDFSISQKKVEPADIDLYQHVNNTSYLRWAENLIYSEKEPAKHCLINYLSESHLGDELDIMQISTDLGHYLEGAIQGVKAFSSLWN